jgi:hypothetical protein
VSFIYPRRISIRRASVSASVGDRGYGAQRGVSTETALYTNLAASIQEMASKTNPTGLPADAREQSTWKVFVPKRAGLKPGDVKSGDIVVDDIGLRYQVMAPIPTSLGTEMRVLLLEP